MGPQRILVVDDELEVLQVVDKKLTEEGYHVFTASTGQEAIDKAKEFCPDLILMDIVLPDIEGPEVIKIIEEDSQIKNAQVIFLSGIVTKDEDQAGKQLEIQAGELRYPAIPKPFTFEELLTEIRKVLKS